MARSAEEMLYLAMEDFRIDTMVRQGRRRDSIPLDLAPFTLVGATTRSGLLPNPLRDRFGFTAHLDVLRGRRPERVIARSAAMLGIEIPHEARHEIAAPLARHAAHREPPPAPCAGLRCWSTATGRRARPTSLRSPRPSSCTTSTRSAWTGSTAPSWTRSCTDSAAGPSGCRRSSVTVGEEAETVETRRRALPGPHRLHRPNAPRGASRRQRRTRTSASSRPRIGAQIR